MTGPTLRLAASNGRILDPETGVDGDQLVDVDADACCWIAQWHRERIEDTRDEIAGRPPGYRTAMLTDRRQWHEAALARHRCPADG